MTPRPPRNAAAGTVGRIEADQIRRALSDPFDVVEQLGLTERMKRQARGVLVLCPHHIERTASCSITSGPDGTIRVKCHGCGWSGDVLHLIAEVNGLDLQRDFRKVVELGAQLGGISASDASRPTPPRRPPPSPQSPQYVPEEGLERFWAACGPPNLTSACPHALDLAVAFHFAHRAWFPPAVADLDLVRVTPLPDSNFAWPRWWPRSRASTWRLVMRQYDAAGRLRGVQGRAVDLGSKDKTRLPFGYSSAGIFFANPIGLALLRREQTPKRVELMEGLSDTVARALQIADQQAPVAVLGLTQGSPPALAEIAWPNDVPVIVLTHADPAGEKLAADARRTIPLHIDVRRADMSKLVPPEERNGRL
jgi:hypothetical protein